MSTVKKAGRQLFCRHLRSKEMYHSDAPHVEDQFHSGIYWCNHTSDGLGPNGDGVDREDCCAGRDCYEE